MSFVEIKKLNVLSVAKVLALLHAVVGLIVGFIYGIALIFLGLLNAPLPLAPSGAYNSPGTIIGNELAYVVIGIVAVIAFPIFSGILGFVYGLLISLIYNTASKFIGGIKFQLEKEDGGSYESIPPQY